MIAVDTNVLVYAFRQDSPHHAAAQRSVNELANGSAMFGVPWPCVHEFLAVVTHPRIYRPPATGKTAVAAIRSLTELPTAMVLSETDDHLTILSGLMEPASVVGAKVHDARIAAICVGHGVTELWTADRDFSYFPGLRTHNPLIA